LNGKDGGERLRRVYRKGSAGPFSSAAPSPLRFPSSSASVSPHQLPSPLHICSFPPLPSPLPLSPPTALSLPRPLSPPPLLSLPPTPFPLYFLPSLEGPATPVQRRRRVGSRRRRLCVGPRRPGRVAAPRAAPALGRGGGRTPGQNAGQSKRRAARPGTAGPVPRRPPRHRRVPHDDDRSEPAGAAGPGRRLRPGAAAAAWSRPGPERPGQAHRRRAAGRLSTGRPTRAAPGRTGRCRGDTTCRRRRPASA
jgi:hypothetical protein